MAFEWFVVQAYAGFENRVRDSLEERIAREKMQKKFHEILIPSEEVVEMRAGQKRQSKRRLFPGYVLVNMEMDDDTWHLVRNVPKVKGFIGGIKGKPTPVPQKEIDMILQNIQVGTEKPKVVFETGEIVRVIDGPFNDFNAVVEEVSYEKSKIQVSVQIFGRSTPVELDFEQVEKA